MLILHLTNISQIFFAQITPRNCLKIVFTPSLPNHARCKVGLLFNNVFCSSNYRFHASNMSNNAIMVSPWKAPERGHKYPFWIIFKLAGPIFVPLTLSSTILWLKRYVDTNKRNELQKDFPSTLTSLMQNIFCLSRGGDL